MDYCHNLASSRVWALTFWEYSYNISNKCIQLQIILRWRCFWLRWNSMECHKWICYEREISALCAANLLYPGNFTLTLRRTPLRSMYLLLSISDHQVGMQPYHVIGGDTGGNVPLERMSLHTCADFWNRSKSYQ